MKRTLATLAIAALLAAPALSLQQRGVNPNAGTKQQTGQIPVSSPEPVTMLALAGGAAAAGGFALSRKRNKRG